MSELIELEPAFCRAWPATPRAAPYKIVSSVKQNPGVDQHFSGQYAEGQRGGKLSGCIVVGRGRVGRYQGSDEGPPARHAATP